MEDRHRVKRNRRSTKAAPPRSRISGKLAFLIVAAAAGVWGVMLVRNMHTSPARTHVEAGIEYANHRMGREAEAEWLLAVRLDPLNSAAWELLGDFYLSAQRYDEALDAFQHLERSAPKTDRLSERIAISCAGAGDQAAAYKHARKELERNPNSVEALRIVCRVLVHKDSEKEHLDYLRRLTRLTPEDPEFQAILAESLLRAHLHSEARTVCDELLRMNPNDAKAFGLRGRSWYEEDTSTDRLRRAKEDLLRAVHLSPGGPAQRLHLGRVYLLMRRPEEAARYLEQAATILPSNADVLFDLTRAYSALNRTEDLARTRRRFVKLRKRADLASELEKRCAIEPENGHAHLRMGLIALEEGALDKADYYLRRAVILMPGDKGAETALKKLTFRLVESADRG